MGDSVPSFEKTYIFHPGRSLAIRWENYNLRPKFPPPDRLMLKVWYFILVSSYRLIRLLFHWAVVIIFWGKSKTVPPVTNPILLHSATELAARIRKGKLKSEDVVRAYVDRIYEVEPYINAVVESRFTDAFKEAREVDELVSSGKMTKEQLAKQKPLLGVPFSVKVLLTVKGLKSTAASLLFEDVRAAEDAPTVALMKEAGAIILAITNSAEMGMHFETNNYLYGKTCNPYDTSRTSGGSSGGESALISAAGSVIGLGNDMAGSIRLPCLFTGIFGHKPTRGVVSNKGCFPVPEPKVEKLLYSGPMCRYAEDLNATMAVLAAKYVDKPLKFGQTVDFKELKIYYMTSFVNPLFGQKVDPETERALKQAVFYFESTYGCMAKEAKIPLLKKSAVIFLHCLLSSVPDIGGTLTAGKGDISGPQEFIKYILGRSKLTIGPIVAINATNLPLVYDKNNNPYYEELAQKVEQQITTFLDEKSVLIIPTFPMSAPYHYEMNILLPNVGYTSIFNVLGLPITQCPLGLNDRGLPLGIQIVGCKNNDPLTITCAIELEKAFGGWTPPKQR